MSAPIGTDLPARPVRPVALIIGVLIFADIVSSFESAPPPRT